MEVHLIRHTPVNVSKKICYGRLDVPLLDSFNHDIWKIKNQLLNKYDIVYSSPAKRCIALAESLKFGEIIKDNRLLEIDFGDWEGLEWDAIDKNLLNHWMEDFVNVAPTNGESFNEIIGAYFFGILPLALLIYHNWQFIFIAIPLFILYYLSKRYFEKRLHGYTGDCLGAVEQLAECICILFYLSLIHI